MKKGMATMKQAVKTILLAIIITVLGLSAPALYGQADIAGSLSINKCDTGIYTITVTNATPGAIGSIVVTNTLPNSNFSYVTDSAVLCFPSPGCATCNLSLAGANPAIAGDVLTWNLDTLCGGTNQLAQGESFTIQYTLSTDCDAISGDNDVRVDYVDIPSGTPLFDTDSVSIRVNPGAVIITKTPFVVQAGLYDNVTWTLTIQNTGLGSIKNVVVTDVLGPGLQYVSDTENGNNSGDTTTWTSSEFGALANMPAYPDTGYSVTIDITARVISCLGLENNADVSWGCDGGPTCFDTTIDGGTATASVEFQPTNPFLVLTPPNITVNYCEAASTMVLSLFNDNTQATGAARNTIVKLQGLDTSFVSITNVQGGVTFNSAASPPQFENIPDIAPGDTYNLTFDVGLIDHCNYVSGQIIYIPEYRDECDNPFYPTPVLGTYNLGAAGASSLSVEKNILGPGTIYIGETVSYQVNVDYSGPTTCGSGTTSLVTVTDTLPAGFTIIDAGTGDTSVPGTIQWTFDPAVSPNFSDTITLQSPDRTQCETYCETTNVNSVTAAATDCCGCLLSASDTATIVIECDQLNLLTSSKTAGLAPGSLFPGPCQTLRLTSEYNFEDAAALDLVDLEELTITENNNNRLTYAGLVSATIDGTDLSGCIAVANNTPAGTLVFTFPTCGYGSVRNRTLTIVYDMLIDTNTGGPQECQPDPPCRNSYSWEDWTDLDLGPDTPSGQCLSLPGVHETVTLTVTPPSMTVAISPSSLGAPGFVENCGIYDINIIATQTSGVNPYDVRLVLENTNYYTIQILDCTTGDVQPLVCDPGSVYSAQKEWIFNDVFTANGTTGIIRLRVQKRCSDSPDLVAHLYYDDLCHDDDDFYNNQCEDTATASSLLLLKGNIFIKKTPEVVFTDNNQVQWILYVTNGGDGVATNVTVEDTLQAAHTYVSSVVAPDNGDVTTTPGTPANGVTWTITSMEPGEVRTITLLTDFTDCQPLGNSVSAHWGCDFDGNSTIDEQCEMEGPVVSTVEIPTPNLVSTSFTLTPIGMCEPKQADITLRNAGQTNVYELVVSQTLPEGLTYGGNPEYRYNSAGPWLPAPAPTITNPTPTTTLLTWRYDDGAGGLYDYLRELPRVPTPPILEIRFDIDSDCTFSTGRLEVETQYKNPCGDTVSPNSVGYFDLEVVYPDIRVTKTRTSPPPGDPIDCGQQVAWDILVENTGTYDSPVVWVEDTMDPGYTFVSSTGGSDGGFNGYGGNPLVTTWEITNLNVGQSTTLTLTADSLTTLSANCEDVDNVVEVFSGCGGVDGSSATKPGVDPPDNLVCLSPTAVQDTETATRQPQLGYLSIAMSPGDIDSCNDSTQLTVVIRNTGPTDAPTVDLRIVLPAGITYNAGTAESGLGTDQASAIGAIGAIGDPAISGSNITFYDFNDKGSNIAAVIQADGGNDTLVLRFTVQSACYLSADMNFDLRYYDCCDDTQYSTTTTQQLTALFPNLTVSKTANLSQVDCGNNVEFTVQVTNNGTGNAEVIRVVDTLGDWLDYAGSFTEDQPGTITPALIGGDPQIVGWEFNDLGPGATATFTFEATLNPDGLPNQNDCTAALRQNNVTAQWACGNDGESVDDNPNTTGYDCTDSSSASATPVTVGIPNLVITGITPVIGCSADGTFTGAITVTVQNQGDGSSTVDFTVQVTDGKGWTGTGTHSGTIAAGNSVTVTINTATWAPGCHACAAPYSLDAVVDLNNDVCECNETDNDFGPQTYTAPIPDLVVNSITPTCSGDGLSLVQVNIENLGCVNIVSSFTLHLEDGQGNSRDIVVNSLNAGANTTVNFTNWPTSCSPASINFTATVDYNNDICECSGANSANLAYNNPSPDLVASTVTPSATCTADGTISGTIQVQVSNNGNGAVSSDFRISINDGQGWNAELWYQADLGGTLPLGASASDTVTFNWTRGFTSTPYVCSFPTFTVTVDSTGVICECSNASNTNTTASYTLPFPNLRILSITPTCTADGSYSVQVVVDNNGCAAANGVVVQLSDNDGQSQSQNVNLGAGVQQTLTFAPWPADGNPASLIFTAAIDPSSAICELSGTDNSANTTYNRPNLNLVSITPSCTSDDTFQVSLVIRNNGSAAVNTDFVVRLTDNDGNTSDQNFTAIGGTLPLNNVTQQTVVFNNWPVDCNPTTLNFSGTLDPTDQVCESNSGDNTNTGTITVYDLEAVSVTAAAVCSSDGSITGTMTVTVANSGGNAVNSDFRVSVSDGQGWSSELWYQADLGGTLPLGTGASDTVTFNWTRNFTAEPYVCNFPAIGVNVDSQGDICECTNANNSNTSSYSLPFPNLRVLSITPTCTNDGSYSVEVVVDNNGCAAANGVVVQLSDNDGQSQSQTINLNAGTQQTLTFAPWPADGTPASLIFTAVIDPFSAICELALASVDNSITVTFNIPNLTFISSGPLAAITPECQSDDTFRVSLVIGNNGAAAVNTDFVVRLTDNDGNTLAQNFTALGGTLPINVGTQQTVVFNNWPVDCAPTTINFSGQLDTTSQVCESNSGDNTDTGTITVYDLEAVSVTAAAVCGSDGNITGTMTVTVTNSGGNAINSDFRISVNDGQGWSSELWYQADLGGVLPLAVGANESVTFNWTRNFTASPYVCNFPSISANVDSQGDICECTAANNQTTSSYALDFPNLTVNNVASTVVCNNDGNLTGTTINVSNTGCGDAVNVLVRLISDCGLTFADQTVNLAAGETRDVFFPFTAGITTCTCAFTGTIDPDNTICELDGSDNTQTSQQAMLIPDLEVQSEALTVTCLDDGVIQVSGTVTLVNNGCGPDFTGSIPMRFTLFDRPGCSGSQVNQWTQTFTGVSLIPGGGTQIFTIQAHDFSANFCTNSTNCQVSIRIEADYNNSICEWDGSDNTYCTTKTSDCLDLEAVEVVPLTNCAEDAALNGTIAVTVRSSGGNPITQDFSIRVDDGQGWTSELRYHADLGGTLPLAAGASSTVTFDWNRTFETSTCDYTNITAQVDSQNEICQCTTENDNAASSYQMPLPNLKPTAIVPSCGSDGNYLVRVTIENDGCSDAGSFTLHLADNQGHTRDITIDSVARGSAVTMDITDWPASCEHRTVTFTAVVDFNNDVCEITGSDNTMEQVHTDTSPDLVIVDVKPNATCGTSGDINGFFTVGLQNNGNGPVTQDFKVIIDDGEGWSTEKFYQADLNGTLPIPVGETVSLRINWNRDFSKEPFRCNFNNITVSLDLLTNVCECAAGNNETVNTYRLPYPDLSLQSLLPICSEDGQRQLQLTMGNNGCEDQREDFNIDFSDNRGGHRTVSFTAMGGTLPLKSGDTQTLNLASWEFTCTGGTTVYTVSIDQQGGGCDLLATNNTLTLTHTMEEPDLLIGDITRTCNPDGSITFTVTVLNQGYGDAANVPVRIYDGNNNLVHSRTMTLPKGVEAQFTFTTASYPQGQTLTFRFVVDEDDQFCECSGNNNEKNTTVRCEGGGESQLKLGKFCPVGQGPGGLFRFELQIQNTGASDLKDVRIMDFLPEGFQYVSGSSALNGQATADPQITSQLTWTLDTLPKGETWTLVFTAVADADIDPGRYCNEALAEASLYGDAVTVVSDRVQCCTVVTRQAGAGCCLNIEEWFLSPGRIPDGPLSFIEPYFQTETAMFTVYSIFNLWQDTPLEKGGKPLFMKERLQNYARSTIEEFYLESKLGLTLPDGTLWLSYAGAYPEKGNSWVRKQVDETMTASQVGFELLALNEAVKVEERPEVNRKLKKIIENKLAFLDYFIDDLPHAWELNEEKKENAEAEVKVEDVIKKQVKKQEDKATLYDKASLYLAMVELKTGGYDHTERLGQKLRELLKSIDNVSFDRNNLRQELLFTLGLLENGQTAQAQAKTREMEKILATDRHGQTQTNIATEDTESQEASRKVLDNLHDYALAAAVDYKAGGTIYRELMEQMKEKYYLKDTGVFAEVQPDFTFKLKLHSLAPVVLSFDTKEPEAQEHYATVLYRTFDEVGLFLKKRNLSIGKPLYSLLKNYPFTEPLLPVLNFTKANRAVAPVFSRDAVIHSTQLKPIGEILIPRSFSKILSPSYETHPSRIAAVSFGLQYFGRALKEKEERVIKEEGRSFDETGKTYIDSLLQSGAGIQWEGKTLLPFDDIAIKGPKQGEHNLEPLNAGNGAQISTATLADYLLAEKYYLEGSGKYAEAVAQLMAVQGRVVAQFKETGTIPEKFGIFIEAGGKLAIIPSKERASKLTVAKLLHVLAKDQDQKFLETVLKKASGPLMPEDLIFLAAAPELVPYFKEEIKVIVDYQDSKVSYNAADIVGRRLLGDSRDNIEKSLENLKKHWDKEAILPTSDLVENIERGLIYHHDPQEFILYLLAAQEALDFRFKRTLNFFTYLLENEWGVAWNSLITLPSQEYQVFREEPRENAEPGDLLTFRVRVDNACPEGLGSAHDLPSLYLKAAFTPSLIYTGTQPVEGLDVLGDFQWYYQGLTEGSVFEYFYQALVPGDFDFNFIDGWIYAGGRQGFEAFGPESALGDRCEDIHQVQRLNIIPFQEIQGLVYEDRNVNGIKDVGEPGIPNILIKDTRGRLFRSDAEGRFTVLAGDEHEGLQVELKSIPGNYLMIENPTKLVNRHYTGEVYFGLIPCTTVSGFVYLDENKNGAYDEGEARPEGVMLKAKDKEVLTGKDGNFIFRNLPELWRQWIEVKKEQLYYKGAVESLKLKNRQPRTYTDVHRPAARGA